jgi:tRNA pseudouridine55 synthase
VALEAATEPGVVMRDLPPAGGPAAAARAPDRPRVVRRPVHGVLLLDKPVGLTSQQALSRASRLLRADKAGHTGTLDPLASGLLPLCFGAATKFSQAGLDADKAYRATVQLGQTRAGGDLEGEVLQERPVDVDAAALAAALARFTGPIEQLPPMHSALKHQGRALYEYARAGIEVEREPRRVVIHRLALVERAGDRLVLDVCCSKGTYVRTLAEDLGEVLGCGAHLAALRRTGSGRLDLRDAVTLDRLEALDDPARDALLLPVDALLADWPVLRLSADEAGRFLTGARRRVDWPDTPQLRVHGPDAGAVLGIGHVIAGELIADRLLSPAELRTLPAVPFPPATPDAPTR